MKTLKIRLIFVLVLSMLVLSGCSVSFGSSSKKTGGNDGGIYKSLDRGEVWQQKTYVPFIGGKPGSISPIDANDIIQDPSDPNALYFASTDNGLFFTYDKADSWQFVSSLGKLPIASVAVDAKDKCVIYVTAQNKLYKSVDCSRSWKQTYVYDDPKTVLTQVVVDSYDTKIIYLSSSRGEVIKSTDGGVQWRMLSARFNDRIEKLVTSPSDTRIMYATTQKKGLFRSSDAGENWDDLKDKLKDFKDYKDIQDLVMTPAQGGLVFLVVKLNIYKSVDGGDTWSKMELITPEKNVTINTIAVDPKNVNELYYVTNTTFYHSIDGGTKWSTKKLPTTRAGWKLLVDQENSDILYMSTRKLTK